MDFNLPTKASLLCLIAMLFLFTNKVQANVDSLRQIWTSSSQPDSARFNAIQAYYVENIYSKPDSVILLANYHIQLSREKKLSREEGAAMNRKAVAHSIKGEYDQAIKDMNNAISIYSNIGDSLSIVSVYNNLANIYKYKVEYVKAMAFYSKSLEYAENHDLYSLQASVLMNTGLIHLEVNNFDLALEYFDKSLLAYKNLGREEQVGKIWLNIGQANFAKKNYQEALEKCRKAIKKFNPSSNQFTIAGCYVLNAKIYQESNQLDSALFYIKKGLDLHQKIGAKHQILEDKIILANLIIPSDVNKATKIGEEILEKAKDFDNHALKIDLFNLLYKCYKQKKNYNLSISMLEQYNTYSDSLRIEQNHIALIKNEIQSEYEKKLFDAQLENEKSRSQFKYNQLNKIYGIIFIASLLTLGVFFYSRSKRILLSKEKEVLLNKISNLNELKNTRNQLIQSEKMASLGQLTAGVAHEINNPINFISSGLVGLKKSLNNYIKSPEQAVKEDLVNDMNKMISAIEEGAKRINKIVKSLRLFSKEDSENYVETNIITGLESTINLLSNKIKQGVHLGKNYKKNEVNIFCFPDQLNQVFMNVLLNAIQAVKESGIIKIYIKEQEEAVVIGISDNGPGISEDNKQKIFDPFYTTKTIQEGTGLGLSITFGIIKKHKGTIKVMDNNPTGTEFIITLPKKEDSLIIS